VHRQIYVNLPVADLPRARAFFETLGYGFDERFSNDDGACLVLGDNLYAMLLTRPFFAGFAPRPVADPTQVTGVLVCVSCADRAAVDALVATALAAGARVPRPPKDHGFMYQHAYEDLDGHVWELVAYAPGAA